MFTLSIFTAVIRTDSEHAYGTINRVL